MVTPNSPDSNATPYAAIDLGSNSFHLAIGTLEYGELRWQHRMSEKVQLGLGITADNMLDMETKTRALECLARFHQRVSQIPTENIRIVGTNALRVIRNNEDFISAIEKRFKQRVEIIAGREEARLIYLGVSQTTPQNKKTTLVIDIGGGSTEFIIGKHFQPILTESLHMGCVSFKRNFFANGKLSKSNFKRAIEAAEQQVQHISARYCKHGWEISFGASGSVKSIFNALKGLGRDKLEITLEDLNFLIEHLQTFESIDEIFLAQLKPERFPIFPSGLSILYGAMRHLNIQSLQYSDGALREGLIYDLLGRRTPENVRARSIASLSKRYSIDTTHANKVEKIALALFDMLITHCEDINTTYCREALKIAAQVHEVGLSISHAQFHKHGAYIVLHSDLAGFSRQEQAYIAALVRLHRRKFSTSAVGNIAQYHQQSLQTLAVILRLAVLLLHSRSISTATLIKKLVLARVGPTKKGDHPTFALEMNEQWLSKNPLVALDLGTEVELLKKGNIELKLKT